MNKITFPAGTQNIHDQAANFVSRLKSNVSNQAGKLDKLSNPLHSPGELASDAAELAELREQLNDLLFSGHAIAFSPYTHRVNTMGHLTANTALEHAADKLTEERDPVRGSHGLALLVTGYTEKQFAENMAAIVQLLPFPEWLAAADKSEKNAVINVDKMQIPEARLNPYWRTEDYSNQRPLDETERLLGAEIAQIEAAAEGNISPVARLKQLAGVQSAALTKLLDDTAKFISLFTGQCYAIKLTGTPQTMANQLREKRVNLDPYSALFIMVSDTPPTYFYEMVSL